MTRKIVLMVGIFTLILMFALTGCGGEQGTVDDAGSDQDAGDEEILEIAYLGGSWGENLAFALAGSEIVTKHAPGIHASLVKSAGSEMNTMMAADMPANGVMYHTTSMDFVASFFGIAPWEEAYPNQRLLTSYNPGILAFVGTIEGATMEDMAGRTISVLPLPSLQLPFTENVLELLGMEGQVDVVQLDFGANEDALRDGTIDGLLCSVYNPDGHEVLSPAMEEVLYAVDGGLYWITIPKEVVAEASAGLGAGFGVREVKPDNFLPNETRTNWGQTVVFSALSVRGDMDEDLAYEITKAIVENSGEFVNYDPGGQFVNPESIVAAMSYAHEDMIHPGAIRYYQEAGLWDTYLEARAEFVDNMGEYEF